MMRRAPASATSAEIVLHQLLDDGYRALSFDEDHHRLWSALTAATDGGKRLRPALVAVAYGAFGGRDDDAVAAMAAAVELLHTAFVIHDDVIDGDDVRRGRPNVTGRFAAEAAASGGDPAVSRRYGEVGAILVGDLALAAAVRAVATCPAPPETVRRLLDMVDRALHITAVGELTDVRLGLGLARASLAEVLTTAERKTAVYSFELPLQAGAVLAGAAEEVVERLGEAGRLIGIAFQLRDDVQGVFGSPRSTGKSALSDLRERKQTALLAHARSTSAWDRISSHLYGQGMTEAQADVVRELLTECGSRDFVEDLAADYLSAASAVLDGLGLPADLVRALATLTDDLAGRAA